MSVDENTRLQYGNENVLKNTVMNNKEILEDTEFNNIEIENITGKGIEYTNNEGEQVINYKDISDGVMNEEDFYLGWLSHIIDVIEP